MMILDAHCEQGAAFSTPGVAALIRNVDTNRGNPRDSAPTKCRHCIVPTCLQRHPSASVAWRQRNGQTVFLVVVN